MATRIGQYVISGELRNDRRNSVFGWIQFAPDYGVRIELTGNLSSPMAGKNFRFEVPQAESSQLIEPEDLPEIVHTLADRQIGVTGEMRMRRVKVPDLPIDEFLDLPKEERHKHLSEHDCLYLEWFSQNGRVVAEIVDPIVDFLDGEDSLEGVGTPSEEDYESDYAEIHFDENGVPLVHNFEAEEDDDSELDDPYGLFSGDLQKKVSQSLGNIPADIDESTFEDEAFDDDADESAEGNGSKRPWDEVLPGLDPETKAMYEQWDEIFEGKKDEPIAFLFQRPLKLPPPDRVSGNQEAEEYMRAILAELALLSVALDVCEHFSPMDTYRLLMEEILPSAKVHPNLAASEMVQHYATSDYCAKCEAEFESEIEDSEPLTENGDSSLDGQAEDQTGSDKRQNGRDDEIDF